MEEILGIYNVLFNRDENSVNYLFAYAILALTFFDVFLTLLYQSSFAISKNHKYNKVVDFRSSIISLGVLGTFVGIFLGLQEFNIDSIEKSIPPLLEGLKTAFVTSIFGMAISIALTIFKKPFLAIFYMFFKVLGVVYRFVFRVKLKNRIQTDKEVKDVLVDVLESFNVKLDLLISSVDNKHLVEELKLLNHKATKQSEDIREFNKKTDIGLLKPLENLDKNFNTLIKLSLDQNKEMSNLAKSIGSLDKKLDRLKVLDDLKEQNRDVSQKLQDLKLNVYYGS